MNQDEEIKFKLLLNDIIRGYSIVFSEKYGNILIKHLTIHDSGFVDIEYQKALEKAIKSGLPTSNQQIKLAIERGDWTNEEQIEYNQFHIKIANLEQSQAKLYLQKEKKALQQEIDRLTERQILLEKKKNNCIGYSAETFANKKLNEFFIYYSFRKQNINTFLFSYDEFDELEENDIEKLAILYTTNAKRFASSHIKRLSVYPGCLNIIMVNGDEIYYFYGKPTCELTFYQIELFSQGKYFKNLIAEAKDRIPQDYFYDPDKLIEYLTSTKPVEETNYGIKKEEVLGTAIVGATKEDLVNMGLEPGNINLSEEARKKGSSLTMEDLIKIHGL